MELQWGSIAKIQDQEDPRQLNLLDKNRQMELAFTEEPDEHGNLLEVREDQAR